MMAGTVRFDCFEVDLDSAQLHKRGVRIRLRDQSFKVLAALLEHAGHVVTRDELRRRLWQDEFFVDFENNLNTAVAHLRQALGDSADHPRFIETVPKRGYRFIGSGLARPPAAADAAPQRARLIVLPFINLTGDPAQEYFSDAITEEVITELAAQAPDLGVIARTSAMRYKRTRKDVAQIGRELNVAYVVEGGVCLEGDRVGITAQLIRASDQTHLFSRRYDTGVQSAFETRSSIAGAIAAAIAGRANDGEAVAARLDDRQSSRRRPTEDDVAYKEYIQGRALFETGEPEAMARARRHFENAIARDPSFALAHDALAELYTGLGYMGYVRPKDAFSIGISHALAAVETDDTLAEAHAVLAEYHKQLNFNWPAAERQMARALGLNASSPIVRVRRAVAVLMPHNRMDEAIGEIERALETDPLSWYAQTWLGIMLLLRRDADAAIRQAGRLLEIEPRSPFAFFIIGCGYRQKYVVALNGGDPGPEFGEEAVRALRKAVELAPGSAFFLGWFGHALGVCGREAEARAVLEQLRQSERYTLPTAPGFVHLGLREFDAAFGYFDSAIEERDQIMMPILSYAHFDPIRADPRFAELLRRMKLDAESPEVSGAGTGTAGNVHGS
jgi:TolB-like protein